MTPHALPLVLCLAAAAAAASDAAATAAAGAPAAAHVTARAGSAPAPQLFWGFDAGFGANMVLQRAPAAAAVYGYLDTASATAVKVTVSDASGVLYSVDAAINATTQPFGDGWGVRPCPKAACPPYDMDTFTPFAFPLPTWKALLRPAPAGGNYTIVAECTGCLSKEVLSIANVVMGDVWICSGQSNAMLWVSHTFSRNASALSYAQGAFNNVRIMGGNDVNQPYASWPPAYGDLPKGSNPWMTAAEAVPEGCIEKQNCPLFQTSGACFYALQNVAESGVSVPLGLVALTLGGQRIEEFMYNGSDANGPYVCENLNSQNIVSASMRTRPASPTAMRGAHATSPSTAPLAAPKPELTQRYWNGQLYGVYCEKRP